MWPFVALHLAVLRGMRESRAPPPLHLHERLCTRRLAEIRSSKLLKRTVNLVLAQLRTALNYAVKVGLLAESPKVEKLRRPKRAPKTVLSVEEAKRLLEAAAKIDPQTELICLLGLHAGLRCSELCAPHW